MKFQITLLMFMLLVASCAPAPEAPVTSNTLPPDTAVTSPPGGTMPTNEAPASLMLKIKLLWMYIPWLTRI